MWGQIALNICDKVFDSEESLFQRVGITLKICKIELPLLMKPGWTDFAFATALVFCLRESIEHGKL